MWNHQKSDFFLSFYLFINSPKKNPSLFFVYDLCNLYDKYSHSMKNINKAKIVAKSPNARYHWKKKLTNDHHHSCYHSRTILTSNINVPNIWNDIHNSNVQNKFSGLSARFLLYHKNWNEELTHTKYTATEIQTNNNNKI